MEIKLINNKSKNQKILEKLIVCVELMDLKLLIKQKKFPFIEEESVDNVHIIYSGKINFPLNREPSNHYVIKSFYRDSKGNLHTTGETNYFLKQS